MKWKTLGVLLCVAAARLVAQEPPWNPNAIKECDRACDRRAHDREHRSDGLTEDVPSTKRVSREVMFRVANNPPAGGALILDEQKQTVGTFPLFVHDGTRPGAASDAPPGMLQNLVTMETFSVRRVDPSRRGGAVRDDSVRTRKWMDSGDQNGRGYSDVFVS